jgi:16S rRNA (guanine527-N7)-methyltransferase
MQPLADEARALFNLNLSEWQLRCLLAYERELLEWNQKFNLTAIRDAESVRTKHFLDSFSCVLAWGAVPPRRLVDVGTGAGFPGLALKILYPALKLTLVESVGKKAIFCRHIVQMLGLQEVEVLHMRAEQAGRMPEHREKYDWAVARAVAKLGVLAEYLLPLVQVRGAMLAQKGESGPAEAQAAEPALKMLGGKLKQIIPVTLPRVAEDRFLVLVEKVAATPPGYPRNPGLPMKRPL